MQKPEYTAGIVLIGREYVLRMGIWNPRFNGLRGIRIHPEGDVIEINNLPKEEQKEDYLNQGFGIDVDNYRCGKYREYKLWEVHKTFGIDTSFPTRLMEIDTRDYSEQLGNLICKDIGLDQYSLTTDIWNLGSAEKSFLATLKGSFSLEELLRDINPKDIRKELKRKH